MSKPKYKWWDYMKKVIRAYPELKKKYDALHEQTVTANMTGMPRSENVSRSTEMIAVRELPTVEQREYESVRQAIECTKAMKNGKLRIRIVDMVYWKKSHNVAGAAMRVGYSVDRGKQIHGDFVRLVAKFYGLMDGLMDTEKN